MTKLKYWWHWYRFWCFYTLQGWSLSFGQYLMDKIETEKAGVERNRWF